MPIWLRKFTFREINEFYKAEEAAIKKQQSANKSSLVDSEGKINAPCLRKHLKHMKERVTINSCSFSYL